MKRFLILAVLAAAISLGFASQANAATSWPATCRTMRCVNKHLNALHAARQAEDAQLASLRLQLEPILDGCWQSLAVSRYDVNGTVYTQGWPYSDYVDNGPFNYPDGGHLDLAHADQPRDGFIYRMIFNSCTSG